MRRCVLVRAYVVEIVCRLRDYQSRIQQTSRWHACCKV